MDREQQIMSFIRRNPFVSQQELADAIGISRSAVAGYVAALTRKGSIRGRAYVLAEEGSVLCIGGANLDSKARGKQPLRLGASNPVAVAESCGGVARNIAANLAALSARASLLTAVGDDKAGRWLLDRTSSQGVDIGPSLVLSGEKTGSYTAILDEGGEMFIAFADMEIYERITPHTLEEKWPHIAASKLVVADANLPADSLAWLARRCGDAGLPLFVDPISPEKAKKLPARLDGIAAVFPNLAEARQLAGEVGGEVGLETLPVEGEAEWAALARSILARGAGHVLITLGKHGAYCAGPNGGRHLPALPVQVVDVTGAGDAFLAGVAYGVLRGESFADACRSGLAAARIALETASSSSEHLNEERLAEAIRNAQI
ncbi:carbohydrate kinase [Cohnella hashimotonis]|uniref:Winged helix-turn-helix transcriptional regulator n=1 Tax=Cohnella hashimotonis TaxID=2826895 RepID=A0ABT6TQ32_9BACL|nr:carbohydrate kinase [Cohnella hashimotonis]MDI4648338.1 winged helix-turn-helix transcriptional regulator [Cohnella hashimotonis]